MDRLDEGGPEAAAHVSRVESLPLAPTGSLRSVAADDGSPSRISICHLSVYGKWKGLVSTKTYVEGRLYNVLK